MFDTRSDLPGSCACGGARLRPEQAAAARAQSRAARPWAPSSLSRDMSVRVSKCEYRDGQWIAQRTCADQAPGVCDTRKRDRQTDKPLVTSVSWWYANVWV